MATSGLARCAVRDAKRACSLVLESRRGSSLGGEFDAFLAREPSKSPDFLQFSLYNHSDLPYYQGDYAKNNL
jgi:hypothetical protein